MWRSVSAVRCTSLALPLLLNIGAALGQRPGLHHLQQFPKYRVIEGTKDGLEGYWALDGAQLCILGRDAPCFQLQLTADEAAQESGAYGLMPRSERVPVGRGSLTLIYANCGGGSGTSYRFALLEYRGGRLHDLFPVVEITNQSDHTFLRLPSVSYLPIFATADADWTGKEAHYGMHHYNVTAYRYDVRQGRYGKVLTYITPRKYRGMDIGSEQRYPLLDLERDRIVRGLSALHFKD